MRDAGSPGGHGQAGDPAGRPGRCLRLLPHRRPRVWGGLGQADPRRRHARGDVGPSTAPATATVTSGPAGRPQATRPRTQTVRRPGPPPGLAGTFRGAGAQPRQRSRIPATLVRPLPLLGGTSARPFMIMNDFYRYSRFFLHSEIFFYIMPMSFGIILHMCLRNRKERGLNPNLAGIRRQEPRPARGIRRVAGRPVRPLHGRRTSVPGRNHIRNGGPEAARFPAAAGGKEQAERGCHDGAGNGGAAAR